MNVKNKYDYKVLDKNGEPLPENKGTGRTLEQAKTLVRCLNKHGNAGPYKIIET